MPPEEPAAPPRSSGDDRRAFSARDVRDLALAVIEGAVAAEALAHELRRTPDRSRHFSDIAARLRAIVARPSIRSALTPESPPPDPKPEPVPVPEPAPALTPTPDAALARIEATLTRLDDTVTRALAREDRTEHLTIESAEEAIALAAKLAERVRSGGPVHVHVER